MKKKFGRLGGCVFSVFLLCWFIPWHFARYTFMITNDYSTHLIIGEIGFRIFSTIFALIFLLALGYVIDKIVQLW